MLFLSSSTDSSLSQSNNNFFSQYCSLSQNSSLSQNNNSIFSQYSSLSQNNSLSHSDNCNNLNQNYVLSQSPEDYQASLSSSRGLSCSSEKIKQILRNKTDRKEEKSEPRKKSKRAALMRDDIGVTNFDPIFKVTTPDFSILSKGKENPNYDIAKKNYEYNRYQNILPEDEHIYAPNLYVCQGKEINLKDYYLNAVAIPIALEGKLSTYVATQAPKENCFNEFWKAVVAGQSDTIVNLAMPLEKNELKCDDYWSHTYWEEQDFFTITDGKTVIGTLRKYCDKPDKIIGISNANQKERIVKREFEFTSNDENEIRIITQFHYENWPDFGVPEDLTLFEELLDLVDKSGSKKGPPIIHCSAGIGRTGTFIVSDALIKQIKDQIAENVPLDVDPIQLINRIREHRKGMVQSQIQLEMIYSIIFRFGEKINKQIHNYKIQNLTNSKKV